MYIRLFWRFVFSFLTLLFNLRFQKETKDTLYCLSVWNVVKDHLAYPRRNRVASRKRVQRYSFFLNHQTFERENSRKMREKINYAVFSAQFSKFPFKNSKNHQNPCYLIFFCDRTKKSCSQEKKYRFFLYHCSAKVEFIYLKQKQSAIFFHFSRKIVHFSQFSSTTKK